MKSFSKRTPFERLCQLVTVTPHEVALAIAGINPAFKIGEVPEDSREMVYSLRKAISRALKNHLNQHVSTDNDVDATLVFASAFLFIDESTPNTIVEKINNCINLISSTNQWESILYNLGGIALRAEGESRRKSGRGLHRKQDEDEANMKMIAVLIHLLIKKSGSSAYLHNGSPNISAIYRDIQILLKENSISDSGIKRAAFADKARRALLSLHDDDPI